MWRIGFRAWRRTPIRENQVEQSMGHEIETGRVYRDNYSHYGSFLRKVQCRVPS